MKKAISVLLILIFVITMMMSLTSCFGDDDDDTGVLVVVPENPYPTTDPNLYKYEYNEATSNDKEKCLRIEPEDIEKTKLAIPKREGYEFDGWYADWIFRTRVSDKLGNIVVTSEELAKTKSNTLYAKWENENAPIYPILMVYVTKIDALLETIDGRQIKVDYSMTEEERTVCALIPPLLEDCLNAMMNGFVRFKVDTFFTTKELYSRSFAPAVGTGLAGGDFHYSYYTKAYLIPELGGLERPMINGFPPIEEIEGDGILSKYKSIFTTFCLNDLDEQVHFVGGMSGKKYASIHMEAMFGSIYRQGGNVDYLLNYEAKGVKEFWSWFMELYLHEFAHTVEMYPENKEANSMDYHSVQRYYSNHGIDKGQSGVEEIEKVRLYLLNRANVNGEILGITKKFWYGER